MAKRNIGWSKSKRERFLKEGRGQGVGKDYKPWLTVQDFPSMGRATRIFGWKTQRVHHFFTDSQTRYFYLLEWEDSIIDIREHFPLLDIDIKITDRSDLEFNLFKDGQTQEPYVLSTTFLVTTKDTKGRLTQYARSIKAASELEKNITLQGLEIERRYWKAKGIDWGIVTSKDIPLQKAKNIEWIHPAFSIQIDMDFRDDELQELEHIFILNLKNYKGSMRRFTAIFDREYNLEVGTGLLIFKYLLASKKIILDMNLPIDLNSSEFTLLVLDGIEGERFGDILSS